MSTHHREGWRQPSDKTAWSGTAWPGTAWLGSPISANTSCSLCCFTSLVRGVLPAVLALSVFIVSLVCW